MQYDELVIRAFLQQQDRLYPEPVATTPEEARAFLEDMDAVVARNRKDVFAYLDEVGVDLEDLTEDGDLDAVSEIFLVEDGRYLILEI